MLLILTLCVILLMLLDPEPKPKSYVKAMIEVEHRKDRTRRSRF